MFHSIAAHQKLLSKISSSPVICRKSLAYEKDVWVCKIWASYLYVNLTMVCCAQMLQSCPTLFDPMDCSLPGSSVHGILKARVLEWVAIPFSRGSSPPRVWTWVSCIAGRFFTNWATREAPALLYFILFTWLMSVLPVGFYVPHWERPGLMCSSLSSACQVKDRLWELLNHCCIHSFLWQISWGSTRSQQ